MSRQDYIRASLLLAISDHFPPLVREGLINDKALCKDYHISVDAVITLGTASVAFKRSKLFAAIRLASATPGAEAHITDESGRLWSTTFVVDQPAPIVVLAAARQSIRVPRLTLLSEDADLRLRIFRSEVERVNLPSEAVAKWEAALANGPFSDGEVGDLLDDLSLTPTAMIDTIGEHLSHSGISMDILVPCSPIYYERLVG